MPRIRKIEIANFRGIQQFSWLPSAGINCLIGPGDSGKSSVLDAIDLCLGARRTAQFTDADFHNLDVAKPIRISLTIGELDDALKTMEGYGMFLRGFNAATGEIEDEPERDAETVLTLTLTVPGDLEPTWTLESERAAAQNLVRNLNWADRVRISPTRIASGGDYNLGWRRGSVLNRLSDERADAGAVLAKAARDARAAFGDEAEQQLEATLNIVAETAKDLGIPVGTSVKAMLDFHSVSFSGGTISLHDECGVPLRNLGLGSVRLLIAGLQRKAAEQSPLILVDELEHGLEPHRIIRFLGALGAKERQLPLQAFITTHSPVALRELSGSQLFVMRQVGTKHEARNVGIEDDIQGSIRAFPDAFLASSIVVCEGASEVGLIRGLDLFRAANGHTPIGSLGVALVDCGGGDADRPFRRAGALHALGYRTAVLRDDDKKPTNDHEMAFKNAGGEVVAWRNGRALEDELFLCLTHAAIGKLIDYAIELHGEDLIDEHIKSASENTRNLQDIQTDASLDLLSVEDRAILGKAARMRKAGWFKSITWMEEVAREIVGPDLAGADAGFRAIVESVLIWAGGADA
jgi:putative ATP-dependent endonuclease of the OLD family